MIAISRSLDDLLIVLLLNSHLITGMSDNPGMPVTVVLS